VVGLVEERAHGARITVHQLPWLRWIFSTLVDPVRYSLTRAVLVGCRVHRVFHPKCFDVRQVGRFPDSSLRRDV
jgi:hypothetical protein